MLNARAAQVRRHLPLGAAALIPALLLALTACGDESTGPASAAVEKAAVTSPAAGRSSGGTSQNVGGTRTVSTGCPKTSAKVGLNGTSTRAGDLDGDGRTDRVWLGNYGSKLILGVKTASGAVFSTSFDFGPVSPRAVGNRLGDGTPVILLDNGNAASLYTVSHCAIVPVKNQRGQQYAFDMGHGGYGDGVGCPVAGGKRYLAGYKAEKTGTAEVERVERTRITIGQGGTRATNGTVTDLGNQSTGSMTWRVATGFSCGDDEPARMS